MNERILILAAVSICPIKGPNPEKTIDTATAAVKTYRESTLNALKSDALFEESTRKWYESDLADCDAWLAAAKLHEEQKAMAERMRAAIAAAPQEVLSDAERAECVAELGQAMVQTGRVSNGEVLLAILEKARKENEEFRTKLGMGPDEPIEDPCRRVEAVAHELARRGIHATVDRFSQSESLVRLVRNISMWTHSHGTTCHC